MSQTSIDGGNGRYRVTINAAGAGGSFHEWRALTRWSADRVEDAQGFFVLVRDLDSEALWSVTPQPFAAPGPADRFDAGTASFARHVHGIDSYWQVSVLPEATLECRTLRLHNPGTQPRRLQLTSAIEVTLAHPMGEAGHPAFSKLFVQTQWRDDGVLLARRRPRAADEHWPLMLHTLEGAPVSAFESDRMVLLGRGGSLSAPRLTLCGGHGNVLDPVFALRCDITLAPGETRELRWWLGAAEESGLEALLARIARQPPQLVLDPLPPFHPPAHWQDADSGDHHIRLAWRHGALLRPPLPWCNVIANPDFGLLISETGAACTWSRNSQANRLTPWSNDPVSDPHGEALYLRDEDSGAFWSPLPGPCPAPVDYTVQHGFGVSRFHSCYDRLVQELSCFVVADSPLRVMRLRLRNQASAPRRLSVFAYARLVLGTFIPEPGTIRLESRDGWLLARNPASADFADGISCSALLGDGALVAVSGDRAGFVGVHGRLSAPAALGRPRLDGVLGTPDDACFAQQRVLELAPGAEAELIWLLGEASSEAQLQALMGRCPDAAAAAALEAQSVALWRGRVNGLRLRSPVPELDALVNGWLPYQVLSCRINGRTAFFQSGGAWGYRDQLQDAGNLALLDPVLTRAQLLLHAAHQFVEGDVLHWWHPAPISRGIRTRFADDLLWLAFVALDYVRSSGDVALWDAPAPYLRAELLAEGEDERYLKPEPAGEQESVYQHCCRAIERSLAVGAHGLPLFGTGDWNDGMNRVGRRGRGESVWMGFFLATILQDFAPLARARGDLERADRYEAHRAALSRALDAAAWDGNWYRRAYDDDGLPLGTHSAAECRIDGLAQSWAVLSGAVDPARARQAMDAGLELLADGEHDLIRLLTPPFADMAQDPGYIKGYVAGVRENGGQYTHAACWFVMALARLGRRNEAADWLRRMAPAWHARDAQTLARYQLEPYVIAADVYSTPPHEGRGGWSWYTGSAGWFWRVAVESICGLRLEGGDTLVLAPCIPDRWPGYALDYRVPAPLATAGARYRIEVENPQACSARIVAASLDGRELSLADGSGQSLRLALAAGEHQIRLRLGA